MKKILLLSSVLFAFTLGAMAQPKAEEVVKINEETHDFGKVKQGVPVTYNFEIKNISDKPIVIANATASCGCTVPEKPEQPIEPGKVGLLKVQYNAAAVGAINKDVHITIAGIELPKTVHITGEVLTAEAYEAYMKEKDDKAKTKN